MTIDTSKRVAVITGCSEINSLGAAFSRELLARGWTVFATARKIATLDTLKSEGCQVLELDVTSQESVDAAAKRVVTLTGGHVNLLINNVCLRSRGKTNIQAGALGTAPLVRTDPAKLAAMHDLHVLGPLRMAQAFFPQLSAAKGARGKIVNIGSVVSHGFLWHAAYASTKAGVQILSDVMRREFEPYNIDVTTVELALVYTAMSTGEKNLSLEFDNNVVYNAASAIEQSTKAVAEDATKAPPPTEIARRIIDAVEKQRSPPKLWLGRKSTIFHWLTPYLPVWAVDAICGKIGRMDLVKP